MIKVTFERDLHATAGYMAGISKRILVYVDRLGPLVSSHRRARGLEPVCFFTALRTRGIIPKKNRNNRSFLEGSP